MSHKTLIPNQSPIEMTVLENDMHQLASAENLRST